MKRMLFTLIVAGLLVLPVAAPAAPPGQAPISGTWETIDCAQHYADGTVDCTKFGDGSTITLEIRPGKKAALRLTDDYSQACVDDGQPPLFHAKGKGMYEVDEPEARTLNADFTKWGCGNARPQSGTFYLPFYWDPGSDTLWTDVPDDGYIDWGYLWYRVP